MMRLVVVVVVLLVVVVVVVAAEMRLCHWCRVVVVIVEVVVVRVLVQLDCSAKTGAAGRRGGAGAAAAH